MPKNRDTEVDISLDAYEQFASRVREILRRYRDKRQLSSICPLAITKLFRGCHREKDV